MWDLEESLAAKVAYQIVGQVEADEIRSSANKPPENARAYDLVLQGLKYHREAEVSGLRKPRRLPGKTIGFDPYRQYGFEFAP